MRVAVWGGDHSITLIGYGTSEFDYAWKYALNAGIIARATVYNFSAV
jgi:hypothetical protein